MSKEIGRPMVNARILAKKVVYSNVIRYPYSRIVIPRLKRRIPANHKRNFYFLSTGRVGTRFISRILGVAANAQVRHQPAPDFKETIVRDVVAIYMHDKEAFARLKIEDFPALEEKVLRQMSTGKEVYGDSLNHMFPFGYMLYKYLRPENLRLIHLVRDPVACGRSILISERDDEGIGRFRELRPPQFVVGSNPAEKTANIWIHINDMIGYQFSLINDATVCKVVRLEDLSLETIAGLYDFLGLTGFDAQRVSGLMTDTSHEVRHSHIVVHKNRKDATCEELTLIADLCRPLARQYGYTV